MRPVWWMVGAAVGSWLIITAVAKSMANSEVNPELAFGMLGPLTSAVATWIAVARTQRLAPERVTAVLTAGFALKFVLFGVYMVVMLRLVGVRPLVFAVGFTSYFIGLHVIEALFLKRLFADGMRSSPSVRSVESQMSQPPPTAEHAVDAAEKGLDLGQTILGHISNTSLQHPLIPLPTVWGVDLSVTKHVLMLWLVAGLLLVGVTALVRRYIRQDRLVPTGFMNALEFVVEYIRDEIVRPNVGSKWVDTWTPLLLTFFFFILTANLIGLVPIFDVLSLLNHTVLHPAEDSFLARVAHGGTTVTGNFNVTAALATITFFTIIIAGARAHGFFKHWKNMVPHGINPVITWALLIPIEIIGMFVRPFALTMRLAANMTGGHVAILAILSFVFIFGQQFGAGAGMGVGVFSLATAVAISVLEVIVVFVQAYVFTLLTAVFVGMAIHAHH